MNKRTVLLGAVLMLLIFLIGFFAGSFVRKTTYQDTELEFENKLTQLNNDLEQAEILNVKLREVYQEIEQKDEEIRQQSDVIAEKEAEIERLSSRMGSAGNSAEATRLKKELDQKNAELQTLKQAVERMEREADIARMELEKTKIELQQAKEQANETTSQSTAGVSTLNREIEAAKEQLASFEKAANFEFQADNFTGPNKRKNKDLLYFSAYFHYNKASSEYDKQRIYDKISSQNLRDRIDSGDIVEEAEITEL